MKNQEALHLVNGAEIVNVRKNDAARAFREWLSGRNMLLSLVMDEPVTNLQMMHAVHCTVALMATVGTASTSPVACLMAAAWATAAFTLAREKGGIR